MHSLIVTLYNSKTNDTVTVTVPNKANRCACWIHRDLLKKHPGYHVRKSKRV